MKRILGLDLGTNSIGWALVNEAENNDEKSSIIKLGVRVNPLTVDEQSNFEKGKAITTNADRTSKRGMRRNLQRYKLRRDNLIQCLKDNHIIDDESILCETGNRTTFETYRNRAKAVTDEVSLDMFARILLMINKKRGYKSSRKANSSEEGQLIDGMSIAKRLYEEDITPGQFVLSILRSGKNFVPDFYRSDLLNEFNKIWDYQSFFYPEILTYEFKENILYKSKTITTKAFLSKYGIFAAENKNSGKEKRLQSYKWRSESLCRQLTKEELVYVLSEVNGQINGSSGYLGTISDRSKELFFNKQTIGQYLMSKLENDPHYKLRNNSTFYRQDYLDEFEKIWECQKQFHPELTDNLKKEIRDIIIFYQRPLKSQKGLLSFCEFESRQIDVEIEGKTKKKTIGLKVCPKSSPVFQEFKIWQVLNNLKVINTDTNEDRLLDDDEKNRLFNELDVKSKLSKTEALKLLFGRTRGFDLNFKDIEGNRTQAALYGCYQQIIAMSGHGEYEFAKMSAKDIRMMTKQIFSALGYNTDFLSFNSELEGQEMEFQPMYQLWHLLYSYDGDNKSASGIESLIKKIQSITGFEEDYAKVLANVTFPLDYGSLSTKAMRKILPYMKEGNEYSLACQYAGYRHSASSLTKEEITNKEYKDTLDLLPRNSLRNPVVEKILNQMINVINQIIETYGKPDEIRIELARELKKNAKERAELTEAINKGNTDNEKYRKQLQEDFGLQNVSRNDVVRYKLWLELERNGYKTLYSNKQIKREQLFSKEIDIEHIIPQSRLFDDSFSNKTLEFRDVNIEKGNKTAMDYVADKYGESGVEQYRNRLQDMLKSGSIGKAKYNKLLMKEADIPSDFIDRDLRNTQYIAKKAQEILLDLVPYVVATTGSITDRLREDWQLVDVMQELNWNKYDRLGMTETYQDKDGRNIHRIKDWTKRNDHRHHAMDALTIAFTKRSFIQYLNNLNARSDKSGSIYAIEQSELYRDAKGKLKFKAPMPLDIFRREAKQQLENILVSIKAKNKVMTQNVNTTKSKDGKRKRIQLTPRGQLHKELIFAQISRPVRKEIKVGSAFNEQLIMKVVKKVYRDALLKRLHEYSDDAKKAFTGKNSIEKNPIWLDSQHSSAVPLKVEIEERETLYPIRKPITKDIKIEKVIDSGVRQILQDRLDEYDGDSNKAFSNLDENPIWLNKEAGIDIRRVRIEGLANAQPLHSKKDNQGNVITDNDGKSLPVDFVNTANNHHVAIFRDENGVLQEHVVSFIEATTRKAQNLTIVDKEYNKELGWQFLFTMKQNEYFVFPNAETGFNPNEIDMLNPYNYAQISPYLFRVQKLASKDYVFRHHLETNVEDNNNLKGITWKRINSVPSLECIVKVRVNHIGQIVSIGEY